MQQVKELVYKKHLTDMIHGCDRIESVNIREVILTYANFEFNYKCDINILYMNVHKKR